jgi:hypothetical protein
MKSLNRIIKYIRKIRLNNRLSKDGLGVVADRRLLVRSNVANATCQRLKKDKDLKTSHRICLLIHLFEPN